MHVHLFPSIFEYLSALRSNFLWSKPAAGGLLQLQAWLLQPSLPNSSSRSLERCM
jgi:hypothetical protein